MPLARNLHNLHNPQTLPLMGATRPASENCHVHAPNKDSLIALIHTYQ